ncbi:MAG TPA: hypothetical protein VGM29_09930 [Polyangiaceae bacterium]
MVQLAHLRGGVYARQNSAINSVICAQIAKHDAPQIDLTRDARQRIQKQRQEPGSLAPRGRFAVRQRVPVNVCNLQRIAASTLQPLSPQADPVGERHIRRTTTTKQGARQITDANRNAEVRRSGRLPGMRLACARAQLGCGRNVLASQAAVANAKTLSAVCARAVTDIAKGTKTDAVTPLAATAFTGTGEPETANAGSIFPFLAIGRLLCGRRRARGTSGHGGRGRQVDRLFFVEQANHAELTRALL